MRWACGFADLLAGACLALFAINRRILHSRNVRVRSTGTVMAAGLLTLGPAVVGVAFPGWAALAAPLLLFALLTLGEGRRIILRRRMAASGPVEHIRHPDSADWTRAVTTTDLSILRYQVDLPNLPVPRLRIAHLSDLHVSSALPSAYFAAVMEKASSLRPDLLVMTGDFLSNPQSLPMLREILQGAAARARLGAFAVLGNHDHWADEQAIGDVLREAGIVRVHEHTVTLALGGAGNPIRICGDERPWGPPPIWRGQPSRDGVTIVLTHTADNIYRLSRENVDLVFAGHYHAGQIRLPGLGSLVVPSVFGRRLDHGHFLVGHTHLFVTAGVGADSPALRLYCPPDFFVVDLIGPLP